MVNFLGLEVSLHNLLQDQTFRMKGQNVQIHDQQAVTQGVNLIKSYQYWTFLFLFDKALLYSLERLEVFLFQKHSAYLKTTLHLFSNMLGVHEQIEPKSECALHWKSGWGYVGQNRFIKVLFKKWPKLIQVPSRTFDFQELYLNEDFW